MKKIDMKEIVAAIILGFCENLAELGCPKDEKDPDMWFRYLSPSDQLKVADKLIRIEERRSAKCKGVPKKSKSIKNKK